ncbi:hypothetical protein D3C81_2030440 [compost metagenome]
MGHVDDRLDGPLKAVRADLIQQQCCDHGNDQCGNDFEYGDNDGVPYHLSKPRKIE